MYIGNKSKSVTGQLPTATGGRSDRIHLLQEQDHDLLFLDRTAVKDRWMASMTTTMKMPACGNKSGSGRSSTQVVTI